MVADANRYFAAQEPWALKKTDPARMGTILWVTVEIVRRVAILSQPYVPAAAAKFLDQLGVSPEDRTFAALSPEGDLKPGTKIATPQPVFPRYVEDEAAAAVAE